MNIVKPKRRLPGALVFMTNIFNSRFILRRTGINIPAG